MLSRRVWIRAVGAAAAGALVGRATAQADVLPAEEAFRLRVRRAGSRQIELMWIAAPGTYLYRDRFRVKTDNPRVQVTQVELPPALTKFDRALEQTVAYYEGAVLVRVSYAGPAVPFHLIASAQGCAEVAGICYPPVSRELSIGAVPA